MCVAGNDFKEDAEFKSVTQAEGIPDGWMGLDVGEHSSAVFTEAVSRANTILWNGPMGVFGAWAVLVISQPQLFSVCGCIREHNVSLCARRVGDMGAEACRLLGGVCE